MQRRRVSEEVIRYVKNGTERIAYQMTRVPDGTEKLA